MALEILYVRLVSILLYPVATYLVISLALLGLGVAGGLLSLAGNSKLSSRLAGIGAVGFSLAVLLSLLVLWFAGGHLTITFLLPIALCLPMFFGGIALSTAFSMPQTRIPILYFADLMGAGVSTILVLLGMHFSGAIQVALVIAIAGLISAAAFFRGTKRLYLILPIIAVGVMLGFNTRLPKGIIPISPKELKLMQQLEQEVQWEYQGWSALARVDVLSIPGDTLFPDEGIQYKLVTHDGGAPSLLINVDSPSQKQFLIDNTIFGVPYWIKDSPSVLVIGLGGGPDVVAALAAGSSRILGAEVNPEMVAIVDHYFADFVDDPYSDPRVQIELADGRHLLARTDEEFDIIQLTGVDTTVASLGANPNLAENYLYTREAFIEYIHHLSEDGLLSISFPNIDGLGLRLLALTNEALNAHGIGPLSAHVVVAEMTGYVHILVSKSPFTSGEIRILAEHYEKKPTSVYFPLYHRLFGTPDADFIAESRLVVAPDMLTLEPYRSYLRALDGGTEADFLAEQPYTLKPPTDDWPFFFVLDKLGYRAANYETLFITLALLLVFSFLLMILPPFLLRRRGLSIPKSGAVVAYFASLGLGFIFVEVLFIQKLSLIVGHPSYSLAITLASLLIASGIGSLLSDKLSIRIERKAMIASISVAVLIILMNVLLSGFGKLILQQTLLLRILLSSLIVAIPGFFMGMPFPSGLTLVKEVAPSFVPWGWGINATFTVIGTILGLLLAMSFGYGTVLAFAAVLYICALVAITVFSHRG
jgi:MFS family permease